MSPSKVEDWILGVRRFGANSLVDGVLSLALLLAVGIVPGGLHPPGYSAPVAFLLLGALFLLSRSLLPLWVATFAAVVLLRLQPIDTWPDQTLVQLSSLASLLSGHGIYDPANGLGMSWSIYLPMGSLFAAFPVWFLGAKFWNFFHIAVPAIYSLPYFVAPSPTTFRLFLGLAAFAPFAAVTGKGSGLELSVAVLIVGFWLLLRERHLALAAALLAYGALLRQPLLFIVPFVALALVRLRAWRAILVFGGVLVFGGLVHVLRNPLGFFTATFGSWADFAEVWFHKLGPRANFSIASVLAVLGDPGSTDRGRQPLYLLLLVLAIGGLALVAWRGRSTESAVACAIVATLLVYVLNRGFVLFHYLVAAAMPALAFVAWAPPIASRGQRNEGGGAIPERILAGGVAAVIFLLVTTPLVLGAVGEVRSWRPGPGSRLEIASVRQGDRSVDLWIAGPQDSLPGASPLAGSIRLDTSVPLELGFAKPVVPSELVIQGARIVPREVEGVTMIYPIDSEIVGFLRSGRVEGSLDGETWRPVGSFRTWVHPSFYPTRVALDTKGEPVRFLRIVDGATWWGEKEWLLGGLSVHTGVSRESPPGAS